MPARTLTPITVDNVNPMEAIVASGPCDRIIFRQDADSNPKIVWIVTEPYSTSPETQKYRGESHIFTSTNGKFQTGQTVGYAKAKNPGESGSFSQREEWD